jgi:hypothetical protein
MRLTDDFLNLPFLCMQILPNYVFSCRLSIGVRPIKLCPTHPIVKITNGFEFNELNGAICGFLDWKFGLPHYI